MRKTLASLAVAAVALGGSIYGDGIHADAATTCTTSAQYGTCTYSPYILNNNEWGEVSGSSQTLTATGYSTWSVVTNQPPASGGVKTYPEDQENYSDAISGLNTAVQTFALSKVPAHTGSGSWEVAADDYLNGAPAINQTNKTIEIMVWVNTYQQRPAGNETSHVLTLDGQTYDLWAAGAGSNTGPILSLVDTTNEMSGQIHMQATINWLKGLGYVPANSTLNQLNMGEEVVNSGGGPITYTYSQYNNDVIENS